MKVWKTIPSWFRLDNYDKSINFTAKDWYVEIISRIIYTDQVCSNNSSEKNKSFEYIKNYTFFSKEQVCTSGMTNDEIELEERMFDVFTSNSVSVRELNELDAYDFFLGSDKKEEIEKDFAQLDDYASETTLAGIKRRVKIVDKYRGSIANVYEYDGLRYLQADMRASDEKILADFKTWLLNTRSDMGDKYLKREFSSVDFKDWHESRFLPYWDLTEIARNENATIPFHVLGTALFPNEYGIDLTERVRKVTKKKCQQIFSWEVVEVLKRQTALEYLDESQHVSKKAE